MGTFLYSKGKILRVFLGLLLITWLPLAEAQQITSIHPRTVLAGKSIELEFAGKNLGLSGDKTLELLASFPCDQEFISEVPKPPEDGKVGKPRNKVRLKVSIPEKTPVGIGWIRLVTSTGITPPVLILIDDLPTQNVAPKIRREEAALLNPPQATESRTPNLAIHHYKLEAKSGQRIAIEVIGSRLGEDVDAVLKLLDSNGRILATSDDEPGSGKDPRIEYIFKEETTAFIEVRDVSYKGGKFYRLRVGDFPMPMAAFPMVAQVNNETTLSAISPSGETLLQQSAQPSTRYGTPSRHSFGFKGDEHDASGIVPLRLVDKPLFFEKEPNNQVSEAPLIESSQILNGRLQTPEDVDIYAFNVKKGQHLHFTPHCRSMGAPTFLRLSLQDEKGRTLASAGEGNLAEEPLRHVASGEGQLYLIIQELAGRGSPAFTYAISANLEATPLHFHWEAGKTSLLSLSGQPGSAVSLKLKTIRKNFGETIELNPMGERAEFEVFGTTTIGKDKGTFDFEIQIPETSKPGKWDFLTLQASHHNEEASAPQIWTDVLDLQNAYQNILPHMQFPPAELLNRIPILVLPKKMELAVKPMSGKPGQELEIKVSIQKKDSSFRFLRPKIFWHGFPKEWKVPTKPIGLNENDKFSTLKVTTPEQSIPGEKFNISASIRGEIEGAQFMRVFSNKVSLKVTGEEEMLEGQQQSKK